MTISLTLAERWIISNQYLILAQLYPDDAKHYDIHREIVERGYEGFYREAAAHIECDPTKKILSDEVIDVMSMYRDLLAAYRQLEGVDGISLESVMFRGYDGNEESAYYSFANFFINKMHRFDEFYGDLNSHCPMRQRYHRMLAMYKSLVKSQAYAGLNAEQIKAVINA